MTNEGSPLCAARIWLAGFEVSLLRVRFHGSRVQSRRHFADFVPYRATNKIANAIRMFSRVISRHRGLSEDNAIRMVHAFVLCHITYVAAMLN